MNTFTKEQAHEALTEAGFTLDLESAEWVKGETRGRLQWTPDHSNPDAITSGTRFYLNLRDQGEYPVLGDKS